MNHHVFTFHKCGSTWIRQLFRHVADESRLNIWVNMDNAARLNQNVDRGASDTMMLYAVGPETLDGKSEHDRRRSPGEATALFVRDPKDVLVSQYWSWRNSHKFNTDEMLRVREILQQRSVSQGLAELIDRDVLPFCTGVREWYAELGDDYLRVVRFESLLSDFRGTVRGALDHCRLEVGDETVGEMEERYSFRALSKGRAPGEEERSSHFRKGVAGDWVNYFDAELARAFDAAYGDVCDSLGYERATVAIG